ncbi:Platelet glycoprotein V [Holothuria leucospilota]|uniref:Platelet glycoprotein V n=1 Tax=Holothuria leucospilota TaxID=206669 RepID=A0A9Q1HLJ2_HOLLE|nr:Platelet glycoprotein V [Holothuria leucospilota]
MGTLGEVGSRKGQRKHNCLLVGTQSLELVGVLLYCTLSVAAQFSPDSTSQSVNHDIIGQDISCDQVCEYDDWFQRAHCDERNLYTIPSSDGCEDTIILELQGNHLTNILVNSLLGYNHLKTLDLSNNDITVMCPGVFSSTKYLTNILINNNDLNELLNGTFTGTENHLIRIYLQRNNIVNIHEHVFQGLKALKSIHLSYNQIQSLPPSVFHGLTRLQYIMLGYNELEHLDATTFKDLVELEVLSLRNNKLKQLPHGLFHGLSSLREVVLSHNELVTLPSPQNLGINSINRFYIDNNNLSQSESILPYLQVTSERLEISNNPLTCDCGFISIQEWYNNRSVENSIEYSVTCNLRDTKYHLDVSLPIPCDHPTTNIVLSPEVKEDPATNNFISSTEDGLPTNDYMSENFKLNQSCGQGTVDIITLTASVYSAVCITICIVLWICYKLKGRVT